MKTPWSPRSWRPRVSRPWLHRPPRETLLRWHRNQEALHRGSNGRAAEWHRERIQALGAQ